MRALLFLGGLALLLSCSGAPSGSAASSSAPSANAPQRGTGNAAANVPLIPIQRADVNEDGEVTAVDVAAVSHYLGQKVPADAATWLFNQEASEVITVGEIFWVRVDVAGQAGEQMDFELVECDFELLGFDGDGEIQSPLFAGVTGGINRLVVVDHGGRKSVQASDKHCALHATVIRLSDGKELGTFTKRINLHSANIILSDINLSRNGSISATLAVSANNALREYVSIVVCKQDGSQFCSPIGLIEPQEYPSDGVLADLQLKGKQGGNISLAAGKYLVVAFYGTKGGQYDDGFLISARTVTLD